MQNLISTRLNAHSRKIDKLSDGNFLRKTLAGYFKKQDCYNQNYEAFGLFAAAKTFSIRNNDKKK